MICGQENQIKIGIYFKIIVFQGRREFCYGISHLLRNIKRVK